MLESSSLIYNRVNPIASKSEVARSTNNKTGCDRESILCVYQNRTKSLQIIKIENITDFFWKKAVFPCQTILFNSVREAELKVYSNDNATAVLTDTISCSRLQVYSG